MGGERVTLAASLLAVTLAGPVHDVNRDGRVTIACLGDSNTADSPALARRSWCSRLAGGHGRRWQVVNRAAIAATVTDLSCGHGPPCGREQLATALAEDRPDAVVLAFGTNDLAFGESPAHTVDAYLERRAEARAAGVRALVALTPPVRSDPAVDAMITTLNRHLRARVPTRDLIDFHRRMRPSDFFDDAVHLNDLGQRKRARRARRALLRGS